MKFLPLFGRYWYWPLVCFYGMEVLHEAGHVVAGVLTGAELEAVELWPWQFSQTVFGENPHPGIVVWGGPVGGIALALLLWRLFRRWKHAGMLQFFAGFSLIANGVYIGAGGFDRAGDGWVMLQNGTPLWGMIGFGIAACGTGIFLWHTLPGKKPVDFVPKA